MKVILSVGAPCSFHEPVLGILKASGCGDSRPSRYDHKSPHDLQASMLKSHEFEISGTSALHSLNPGKLWSEMAVDLFMANIDQGLWGWADHQSAPLIGFWAAFDPQVRFLFCYESPSAYVASALASVDSPDQAQVDAALAEWIRWNNFLIERFKEHRKQSVLVNSHEAMYDPLRLLVQLGGEWQVGHADVWPVPRDRSADLVAAQLASGLLQQSHAAWELLERLDAAAHIPAQPREAATAQAFVAWGGWTGVRTQLNEHAHLPELAQRTAELTAELARCQEICEAAQSLQADAELRLTELRGENESLITQVQQLAAQIESTATQARSAEFQQVLDQVGHLRDQMEEERRTNIRAAELVLENEHLLAALHQVQEQLEQLVSSSTAMSFGTPLPPEAGAVFEPPQQGVELDMCHPIEGENWYPAETDGRWAGPGLHSSIRMPPLRPGAYALEMSLADAIAADIVYGLRIEAFGRDIPFEFSHAATPGSFPIICKGTLQVPPQAGVQPWQLGLRFPRTVSPADNGSSDQRHLAIRVRGLQVKPANGAVHERLIGLVGQQ